MSALTPQDQAKRAVGLAAVERYVRPGMLLGLGSGTTSHWFVRALGAAVAEGLDVRGVPTSTATRELAESLGSRSSASTRSTGWSSSSTGPTRSTTTAT